MSTVVKGRKACTRCKKNKLVKFFRTRSQKRKNTVYYYLNSTCRSCDAEQAREYWNKIKTDPAVKKKNRQRVKLYSVKNSIKVKQQRKIYRERPGGKDHRKEYDKKNKDRIALLSKKRNIKYVRKNVAAISDQYVISQLRTEYSRKHGFCAGVEFTKKQIREKKLLIATNRITKLLKKLDDEN